jgi:outer membrane protein TolC
MTLLWRWWMPSTTFGATSFVHSGNALNANGEMFTEVDSRSAELGFALSFNADASRGLSGVKSEKLSYQATLQEVKSDRDAFVLSCMNTFISAVAAKRDFDFHKQALEELLSFEIQYQALADLGLRPQSDALSARTERLQLESLLLTLQANIALVTAELRGALGMSMNPEIESVWPIPDLTIELIATNLPARQALIYRVDEAKANMRGVLEEVWAPELRLNPMYSSFGTEFNYASLAPTNEWVTSLVFSFPIENLLPGGKRKQTSALVDYSEARLSEWDLRHSAYVDGLVERIQLISEALESSEQAVSSADLSLSDVVLRMAHGIVDPVELLSVQRARLNAHSRAISLKEQLLKLEFELISETNPKWN